MLKKSLLDSVCNNLDAKATKHRIDALNASVPNDYGLVGAGLYEVLCGIKREFLDDYTDFSELVAGLPQSTYNQYVYKLKLRRKMTEDEVKALLTTLRRELARVWGMTAVDFARTHKIKVINGDIFLSRIA